MSEVVEKTVKKGLALGASGVEAHYSIARNVEVKIESNEISDASLRINRSLHIAVFLGKRLGFSRTTDVSAKGIENAVENAYHLASSSNENPLWKKLPSPRPFPSVRGTFDERIYSFEPDNAVKLAKEMLSEARKDSRVSIPGGLVSLAHGETHVANSLGVLGSDKGTGISMELMAVAKNNGEVGSFALAWEASRKLDLNPVEIGREAATKAVESLGAKKIESLRGTLILDYDVAVEFVSALSEALNGDMVWRGSSPLKDKVGQEVAVSFFSLVDDGTLDGGVSTSLFDYEGVPRMRTILIDQGVLKGFLHNTYTAGILGVETTGNASGFLSVAPSNIVVSSGDWGADEMVKNVKRGLIVKRFSGYMRPEDGVVSGSVKQAFLVENGEVKHPVKECMISENLYALLKNIAGMSRIVRKRGQFTVPQVMFENVSIVG